MAPLEHTLSRRAARSGVLATANNDQCQCAQSKQRFTSENRELAQWVVPTPPVAKGLRNRAQGALVRVMSISPGLARMPLNMPLRSENSQ
jgi:hypothetical protein